MALLRWCCDSVLVLFAEHTKFRLRRGGRVVECGGLENRYTRKGIESSNLSLSALSRLFLLGFCPTGL